MSSESQEYRVGFANAFAGSNLTGYLPKIVHGWQHNNVLFHYTNVSGFFGIVESNTFWVNHIRYLNDYSEVLHGRDLAVSILNKLTNKPRLKSFAQVLEQATAILLSNDPQDYYVTSFSTLPDDLSQWRAYGANQGICIGIDMNDSRCHQHVYFPVSVLYREFEKISAIIYYVKRFYREFELDKDFYQGKYMEVPHAHRPPYQDMYADSLARKLSYSFIRFKHQSFASEREVRFIVSSSAAPEFQNRHFRVRGSSIIPYYKVSDRPLINAAGEAPERTKIPLSSITVGPMIEQQLCCRSIQDYLAYKGYNPDIVKVSNIPYRSQ